MKKKKNVLIFSLIILAILSGTLFLLHQRGNPKEQRKEPFFLEIGYEVNDSNMRIIHPKTTFDRSRPLLLLAVFNKIRGNDNVVSTVKVVSKSTNQIEQEYSWRESEYSSQMQISLENTSWSPGEYTIVWERDGVIVADVDLKLLLK
ncbi:hypothetical protein [Gorillibacterium timonense]|uniref:hypothetical protein n=1 Tax=Gorillibacterium timonense TaxID=1689269 RepID=UPI00071DC8AF|nr:hypothetical protein [Gorillibacterium timonense]